jgi:hypothetical protein
MKKNGLLCFFLIGIILSVFGQEESKEEEEEELRTNWLRKIHEEDYKEITDKNRMVVRFIWNRSFDNLIVIRIENVQKGVVVDSISGDYGLVQKYCVISKTFLGDLYIYGTKERNFYNQSVNEISKDDFQKFTDLINKLKIKQKKSVRYQIEDGSDWDFEIVVNGEYFRLDTNSPDNETKTLGLEMIKLSGLKIEKSKIY